MSRSFRAVLTVDLAAITANWRQLAELAAPAEVAAVVKADAYGLGLAPVAQALARAGARTFFVARLEEGLRLRALQLADIAIAVLDGLGPSEEEIYLAHRLWPVLNDPAQAAAWAATARRAERRLPAILQLDTGMTRLGMAAADLARLDPADLAAIDLRYVMSHLACADEPGHPMNVVQRERLVERAAPLRPVPLSLANSAGLLLGPAWRFALCRPGIALYGGNPTISRPNPMRPVVRLEAPVVQVYAPEEPGAVGYAATYAVRPGMRIATVPVGYADGLLRSAGARAKAVVGDRLVPYAGRISMDLASLDVSACAPDAVRPGAVVELVGPRYGIDDLAAAAGSIPYEVLVRLGDRFERRYTGGAEEDDLKEADGP